MGGGEGYILLAEYNRVETSGHHESPAVVYHILPPYSLLAWQL